MKYFLLFILAAANAHAIVDMKNANYTNSWIDLEVPGTGYDMKIVRSYNSRSLFNGMFGFGWCSDFETSLKSTPEGNIQVTECGSGQEIIFSAKELSQTETHNIVTKIMTAIRTEKKVGLSEAVLQNLQKELSEDSDKREIYANKYNIKNPITAGTRYYANGKEVEFIQLEKTHYTRAFPDGSFQRFSLDGKIIAMYDKNSNFIKFEYNKNTLTNITDNSGRKLNFKYYSNSKVKEITGPNSLTATYAFAQNNEDLTKVKNAWNNTYGFEYDDLHNLTKANWPDKTSVSLKYDKKNDWVIGFTDRQSCTENYSYEFDNKDPKSHYWSTVKKSCGNEVTAENKFEFWYKIRADGEQYLSRVLTNISNNETDIFYHELHGKPTSIRKNQLKTTFDYFPNGQIRTKVTANAKLSYEYENESNKVSRVLASVADEKGKVIATKSTNFKYDKKGNLVNALNSEGLQVTMTYDNKGRIATITDQAKKVVKIDYDERFGKPAVITRPGLGTIKVQYKADGEISNVESKEGPSIATQVASIFNNLLDVISPANNELYL